MGNKSKLFVIILLTLQFYSPIQSQNVEVKEERISIETYPYSEPNPTPLKGIKEQYLSVHKF